MVVESETRLELLISGFIRQEQNELELYMNVPKGITKIMQKLYPLLFFKFGDFEKGTFEVNEDRTILKGSGDCNGFLFMFGPSNYCQNMLHYVLFQLALQRRRMMN